MRKTNYSEKVLTNPYLGDVWYTPQEDEQLNFTLSPAWLYIENTNSLSWKYKAHALTQYDDANI